MERVEGCGDYFEKGCVDIFNSKFVKFFTDNQNVDRISEVGSMKKDLQSLAIDIFHFCVQNCICLKVQWIPKEYDWSVDNNWLVPPVSLTAHTIKHIRQYVKLVVPASGNRLYFFPMLVCPKH